MFTFGSGSCGQLGHGDCQDLSMPRRVGALVGIVMSMVACGEEYTVCAAFDRRVFGFGLNNVGQLGASSTSHPYLSEPRQIEFLKEEEVELCRCNQSEVIALTRRGALRAWGGSSFPSSSSSSSQLRSIAGFDRKTVERIECGRRHVCILQRSTHAQACKVR